MAIDKQPSPGQPPLTARLARLAIETDTCTLPSELLRVASAALADTIGCALAAHGDSILAIAYNAVARPPGDLPAASAWGRPHPLAAADAAFFNAIAAHVLDFDDNLPTLRGHPSVTLVPTVLAAAEACGASGRDALAAYVIGAEIDGKIGVTMGAGHYDKGWHPTSTVGIYGATAAAARLFGLSAEQLAIAWAIAASQAAGLSANFGTMTKPFHAGRTARAAIESVLLARAGFTGSPTIFDGAKSALAIYRGEDGQALEPQLERFGQPWELASPGLYLKRWPCCYCSHRPVLGLMELAREHGVDVAEIEGIEIGFPPGTDGALIKRAPLTGLEAKFSAEYAAVAALIDGDLPLASFTDAMLQRPQVQALMQRVRTYRIEDPRRLSPAVGYNDVAIVTRRGRFTKRIDVTPGAPERPLLRAELDAKFMANAEAGHIAPAHAKQLLELVHALEDQKDCAALAEMLRACHPPSAAAQPACSPTFRPAPRASREMPALLAWQPSLRATLAPAPSASRPDPPLPRSLPPTGRSS
jgi:2-methylcitrate dehydratase PrpD